LTSPAINGPYTRLDLISSDHASLVKFIERNWGLPTITRRSRDNLPNPIQLSDNPYVPVNSPAIGDLFDLFDFDQDHRDYQGQGKDDVGNGGKGFSPF
jgi:phospholipase C